LIEFPQLGDPSEVMRHSRAELTSVILPRIEETFDLVLEALQRSGATKRGMRRAVLTGGGSLLVGARETAERAFGVKTRIGRPQPLSGAPDAATAPQFSVAVGALQYAARLQSQAKRKRRSRPVGADLVKARGAARGVIGGVAGWLKANF
jgi:cell division protein FtsA